MAAEVCPKCKGWVDLPHCDSRTCPWMRCNVCDITIHPRLGCSMQNGHGRDAA